MLTISEMRTVGGIAKEISACTQRLEKFKKEMFSELPVQWKVHGAKRLALRVRIIEARDLPIADLTSSDPFVEMKVDDGKRVRSTIVKHTVHPVWPREGNTFVFCLDDSAPSPSMPGASEDIELTLIQNDGIHLKRFAIGRNAAHSGLRL